MSHRQPIRTVEDYTTAFWITLGVLFFMGSWLIAAVYGFAKLLICVAAVELFVRFRARRLRR